MPRYLIERNVPGAHEMSPEELREAANKSCDVLDSLGTGIQWQHSYVTRDRINCVYIANNPGIIREHARCSGFPADRIEEIVAIFDPSSAEPRTAVAATTGEG